MFDHCFLIYQNLFFLFDLKFCVFFRQEDGNSDLAEIKKTLESKVPLLNACKYVFLRKAAIPLNLSTNIQLNSKFCFISSKRTSINVILKETPQDRLYQSPAKKKRHHQRFIRKSKTKIQMP